MSARQVYVYYRVSAANEAAAVVAVRALQAAWSASCPGLSCEVLRRDDGVADPVTLMETYRGLPHELQARIEAEAATRLGPWLVGERRVEVFAPCA